MLSMILAVAHPVAVARALHHVRRGTHVLLPAGNDDVGVTEAIACAASITAFSPEPQTC